MASFFEATFSPSSCKASPAREQSRGARWTSSRAGDRGVGGGGGRLVLDRSFIRTSRSHISRTVRPSLLQIRRRPRPGINCLATSTQAKELGEFHCEGPSSLIVPSRNATLPPHNTQFIIILGEGNRLALEPLLSSPFPPPLARRHAPPDAYNRVEETPSHPSLLSGLFCHSLNFEHVKVISISF